VYNYNFNSVKGAIMAKVITSKMLMALQDADTFKVVETVKDLTNETDEEIMERIGARFDILEDMTRAVKKGDVKSMIVTGPPGVGKSYGVEKVLSKHDVFATVAQDEKLKKYEVVKGAMSAIGLYSKLYEFSDKKCILVFDDCDSVLQDELSLNILKAALDSGKKRMIHWNTDSRLLRSEGVPNSFEFKGGAIFITNIKVDFISTNAKRMRELSLRMVLKVADIRVSMPHNWKAVVEVTCMRNAR